MVNGHGNWKLIPEAEAVTVDRRTLANTQSSHFLPFSSTSTSTSTSTSPHLFLICSKEGGKSISPDVKASGSNCNDRVSWQHLQAFYRQLIDLNGKKGNDFQDCRQTWPQTREIWGWRTVMWSEKFARILERMTNKPRSLLGSQNSLSNTGYSRSIGFGFRTLPS